MLVPLPPSKLDTLHLARHPRLHQLRTQLSICYRLNLPCPYLFRTKMDDRARDPPRRMEHRNALNHHHRPPEMELYFVYRLR